MGFSHEELDQFPRIKTGLVLPCRGEAKRRELILRILRHRNYPAWLEQKLTILADTPNIEVVLSEIRRNPSQIDDYVAMMKIAAYFVKTFHSKLEFLSQSKSKRTPDIRIKTKEGDTFIEVKHLIDNSHWDKIQDDLRSIPSGLWVDIEVDYELSPQEVKGIIEVTKNALRRTKSHGKPKVITHNSATIRIQTLSEVSPSSTLVVVSPRDLFHIVSEQEYRGEPGQITYRDLRDLFAPRMDKALAQLLSVNGFRAVIFDVARFVGGFDDVLKDPFWGTPMVLGRDGEFEERIRKLKIKCHGWLTADYDYIIRLKLSLDFLI